MLLVLAFLAGVVVGWLLLFILIGLNDRAQMTEAERILGRDVYLDNPYLDLDNPPTIRSNSTITVDPDTCCNGSRR